MNAPNLDRPSINLTTAIDEHRLTPLHYFILILTFIATVTEGFDVAAAAYTAPGIIKEWQITRTMMGGVFSAALIGMFFGSIIFGYVGDRFGRKVAILSSLLLFGVCSLLCALAASLETLIILRFIMGAGAGGLLTNNISLVSEFAPARVRASFVMLVAMGMTVGGGVVALVSAALSEDSWRTIFVIGGIAPLTVAPFILFFLPESIKFLASKPEKEAQAKKVAQRLLPDAGISDAVDLFVPHKAKGKPSFKSIFDGKLALITPLLWIVFICIQATQVGLSSWLPTILRDTNASHSASSLTAAMFYVGGILAAFTVGRAIDRFGYAVLSITFVLAVPVIVAIGLSDAPQWVKVLTVFMTGFAILGTQLGSNTSSLLYPPAFRSIGYGTASAMGRIGGIGGPLVLGWLMTIGLPLKVTILAPAVPMLVGAIAVLLVAKISTGKFFGQRITDQMGK